MVLQPIALTILLGILVNTPGKGNYVFKVNKIRQREYRKGNNYNRNECCNKEITREYNKQQCKSNKS